MPTRPRLFLKSIFGDPTALRERPVIPRMLTVELGPLVTLGGAPPSTAKRAKAAPAAAG